MTHAFAADDRASYFDATFFTNDTFIPDAFVLTTVTFVVLVWPKDLFVEETVALAALCTVVDGFWFGYFTK